MWPHLLSESVLFYLKKDIYITELDKNNHFVFNVFTRATSMTRISELSKEKTPEETSFTSIDIPNETHSSQHSPFVQEDRSSWKSWDVQLAHCQQWASLPGEVLLSGPWPGTAPKHPRSGQSFLCWKVFPSTHFRQILQCILTRNEIPQKPFIHAIGGNVAKWTMNLYNQDWGEKSERRVEVSSESWAQENKLPLALFLAVSK